MTILYNQPTGPPDLVPLLLGDNRVWTNLVPFGGPIENYPGYNIHLGNIYPGYNELTAEEHIISEKSKVLKERLD